MPLIFNSIPPKTCDSPVFNLNIISEENEVISYGSSDNTIASVSSNGNVTIYKAGTVNITGYTATYTGVRPLLINKINQNPNLPSLSGITVDSQSILLPKYTDKIQELNYTNFSFDEAIDFSGNFLSGLRISGSGSVGTDISIDSKGKTLVAAAPNIIEANITGRVFIYNKTENDWYRVAALTGFANSSLGSTSSSKIKINGDGNTIFFRNSFDNSNFFIVTYTGSGSNWNYDSTIVLPTNEYSSGNFGRSISCNKDGSLLIVGAPKTADILSGEVLIYKKINNNWNYVKNLISDGGQDRFGYTSDSNGDGNILVIGGYSDSNVTSSQGAVWVFTGNGADWNLANKITGDGILPLGSTVAGDFFGYDVSINNSGNIISIGAIRDNSNSTSTPSGSVFIFTGDGSNWINTQIIRETGIRFFGRNIDLNDEGNILIVSSPLSSNPAVYIYSGQTGYFNLINKLNSPVLSNYFGGVTTSSIVDVGTNKICISNDTIFIGAYNENTASGVLYEYNLNNYLNIKKGGIGIFTVNQAGTDCYNSLNQIKIFEIIKRNNLLNFNDLGTKNLDDPIFNINAVSNNIISPILYTSSDNDIAEISAEGNITTQNIGEVNITAYQNEDDFYYSRSVTKSLKIIDNIISANSLNQKIISTGLNLNNDKNNFGYDVDINYSGDKIAISNFTQNSINESINPTILNISNTGSVSIYSKDANNIFNLEKVLYGEKVVTEESNETETFYFTGDNLFGKSLSLNKSGNIIAIGAPGISSGIIDVDQIGLAVRYSGLENVTGSGSVYIYSGNNFDQKIKITGGQDFDAFGFSVSIAETGDRNIDLIVGAPYYNRQEGIAYLYNYTGLNSDFDNPRYVINSLGGIYLGASTAINKNSKRILIGAPNFYNFNTGSVYLYDYSNLDDVQLINTFSGQNHFGSEVSFNENGNVLAIAADDSIYLYKETGDNLWSEKRLYLEYKDALIGWGNNQYNRIPNIDLLKSEIKQIDAGERFSIALLTGGTVTGWGADTAGSNDFGWITSGKDLTGIEKISVGSKHILALLNNGYITGWGDNRVYNTQFIDTGVATGGNNLTGVIDIWAGFEQSIALLNDGRYTGWGYDSSSLNFKRKVSGLFTGQRAKAIGLSKYTNSALICTSSGTLTGWDNGGDISQLMRSINLGQTISGLSSNRLTGVKSIEYPGGERALFLFQNGDVVGIGNNNFILNYPNLVIGGNNLKNVSKIKCGVHHNLALLNNGQITGWGYDDNPFTFPYKYSETKGVIKIEYNPGGEFGLNNIINLPLNFNEGFKEFNDQIGGDVLVTNSNNPTDKDLSVIHRKTNGTNPGVYDAVDTTEDSFWEIEYIAYPTSEGIGSENNEAILKRAIIVGNATLPSESQNYGAATGGNYRKNASDIAVGYYHSIATDAMPITGIKPIYLEKTTSLDLNSKGNVLIAGNSYFNSGYVFTGNYNKFQWGLKNKLSGHFNNTEYGLNIATDYLGNYTVIGANKEPISGAAYIYRNELEISSSSSSSSSSSALGFSITSPSIAIGKLNTPFTYSITTSSQAESYNLLGALPPGLVFDSETGVISGTITDTSSTLGNYTLTIQVSDGNVTLSKTLTIYFLRIFTTGNIFFNVETPVNIEIITFGSPDSFSITGLPSGLTYDTRRGIIIGSTSQAGSFTITVTITKSNEFGGNTITETSSSIILKARPVITSSLNAEGTITEPFSYTITAKGNPNSYTFIGGTLPNGLDFNPSTGVISGTPTVGTNLSEAVGVFILTLIASKDGVQSEPIYLALKIKLKITNTNILIENNINESIPHYQVTAAGSPTTFLAEGIPNGLVIDSSTGLITGIPRIDGVYQVLLRIKNEFSEGEKYITFIIKPRILNTQNILGKIGENLEYEILTEGQIISYSVSFLREDEQELDGLYLGLSISDNKIIGSPNRIGKYRILLKAASLNSNVSKQVILQVTSKLEEEEINHEAKNIFDYKIKINKGIKQVDYLSIDKVDSQTNYYKFLSGENILSRVFDIFEFDQYDGIYINNSGVFRIELDWHDISFNNIVNDYAIPTGSTIHTIQADINKVFSVSPFSFIEKENPSYSYSSINILDGLKLYPDGKIKGFLENQGIFYTKLKISDPYGEDEGDIKITVRDSTIKDNVEIVSGKSEVFSESTLRVNPLTGEKYKIEYVRTQESIWASYDLRNKETISGSGYYGMNFNEIDAFTIDFDTHESGVLEFPSLEYQEIKAPLDWSCLSFIGSYEKLCSKAICYICNEARIKYKNNENSMFVRKNLIPWPKYDKYFNYRETDNDQYYYELIFDSGLFEFCCSCLKSEDPLEPPPCGKPDDSSIASLYEEFSLSGIEAKYTGQKTDFSKVFFLDDLPANLVTEKYSLNFYSGQLNLEHFRDNDSIIFKQYQYNYNLIYNAIYGKTPIDKEIIEKFIFSNTKTGENYFSGKIEFIEKFNNKLAAKNYRTWVPLRYDNSPTYISSPLISGFANSPNDNKINFVALLSGKLGAYDISLELEPRLQISNYLVPEVITLQGSVDGQNWENVLTSQNLQPINVYLQNKNITGSSIAYEFIEPSELKITGSYTIGTVIERIVEDPQEEQDLEDLLNNRDAIKFTSGKYICLAKVGASGKVCGSGFMDIEMVRDFCVPTGTIDRTSSSSSFSSSSSQSSKSRIFESGTKTIQTEKIINTFRVGFFDYKNNTGDLNYLNENNDLLNNEVNNDIDYSNYKINDYIHVSDKYFEFDNYKWIDEDIEIFGDVKYIYGITPFTTLNIVKNRLVGFFPRYITGIFTIKVYIVDKEDRTTEHLIRILVNENPNPCPPFSSSSSISSSSSSSSSSNLGYCQDYGYFSSNDVLCPQSNGTFVQVQPITLQNGLTCYTCY